MEWLESTKNNSGTGEKGHLDADRTRGGEGFFEQKSERKQTAVSISVVSSFDRSLFTVFLCVLLGVLHKFGTIFAVLLCQVGPQRVLRLWAAH